MAAEEGKKVEVEATKEPEPAAATAPKEDVAEEKAVIPSPEPPVDNSKALVVVESEHSTTFSVYFPLSLVTVCKWWRCVRILGISTKISSLRLLRLRTFC
jgi:hypothetical protein